MIFCFDAKGNVLGTVTEKVYQGSVKANTIYFLSPVAKENVVSVKAEFPDGRKEGPFVMERTEIAGVFDRNLAAFTVWKKEVDAVMSGVYGKVGLQFEAVSASGEKVSTKKVYYIVERGIETEEPEQGDSYAEFVRFAATLSTEMKNLSEQCSLLEEKKAEAEDLQEEKEKIAKLRQDVDLLGEITEKGFVKKKEVSYYTAYPFGKKDIKVVDGMKCVFKRIEGNTGENYKDGGISDSYFYGIESYAQNLWNTNVYYRNDGNVCFEVDSEGICHVDGHIDAGESIFIEYPEVKWSGNFSIKFEKLSGNSFDSNEYKTCAGLKVTMVSADGEKQLVVDEENSFAAGHLPNQSGGSHMIKVGAWDDSGIECQGLMFKIMVVYEIYTEETMPSFKKYQKPDLSFKLEHGIYLGKYDYIDVPNKKVIRKTGYLIKDSEITVEEFVIYDRYTFYRNKTCMAYEKKEETVEDIDIPDGYISYDGGVERVVFDDIDYLSCYPTLVRDYYVKI